MNWINSTKTITATLMILISVAFVTLLERKILGLSEIRKSPEKTSIMGALQPLADAMKLMGKQTNLLTNFSFWLYYFSTLTMLTLSLFLWNCMTTSPPMNQSKLNLMMIMLALSLTAMKTIMSGWSTASKYPLMGMIRTMSQLISYESIIYLTLLNFVFINTSLSTSTMNFYFITMLGLLMPLLMYIWIPSILADLNRIPLDLSESESELVSGFNTEFGSSSFTIIFLAEYSNLMLIAMMTSMMMLNLQENTLMVFMSLTISLIWVRGTLPRMRFDKLMNLAWKFLIPFITLMLMMTILM